MSKRNNELSWGEAFLRFLGVMLAFTVGILIPEIAVVVGAAIVILVLLFTPARSGTG